MSTSFDFIGTADKPALIAFTTPDWLETAKTALAELGFKVHTAATHSDFLIRFSQVRYQVVLLEERFVNAQLVPEYHRQDFSLMTTYDYLQAATPLTEVEQVISAVPADAFAASHLTIRPGEPCLLLHRRTWSGAAIATVNTFTYAGSRYSLGSRYTPAAVGRAAGSE